MPNFNFSIDTLFSWRVRVVKPLACLLKFDLVIIFFTILALYSIANPHVRYTFCYSSYNNKCFTSWPTIEGQRGLVIIIKVSIPWPTIESQMVALTAQTRAKQYCSLTDFLHSSLVNIKTFKTFGTLLNFKKKGKLLLNLLICKQSNHHARNKSIKEKRVLVTKFFQGGNDYGSTVHEKSKFLTQTHFKKIKDPNIQYVFCHFFVRYEVWYQWGR